MGRAERRARKQANKEQAKQVRYSRWRRARRRRLLMQVLVWGTVLALVAGMAGFLLAGDGDPVAADASTSTTEATTTTLPEALAGVECSEDEPETAGGERPSFDEPPAMEIDTATVYRATIETTCGTMVWELDPQAEGVSPAGVNNFVFLARQGFYDGLTLHRVIPDFVIQGGDPEGTGTGGPGYSWGSEDDTPDDMTYAVGDLAYANSNAENTTGSQFFVITGAQGAALPPDYIKFGAIAEGLEIAQRISFLVDTSLASGAESPPVHPVWIERVTIEEA